MNTYARIASRIAIIILFTSFGCTNEKKPNFTCEANGVSFYFDKNDGTYNPHSVGVLAMMATSKELLHSSRAEVMVGFNVPSNQPGTYIVGKNTKTTGSAFFTKEGADGIIYKTDSINT